jgi:hypothetical protein
MGVSMELIEALKITIELADGNIMEDEYVGSSEILKRIQERQINAVERVRRAAATYEPLKAIVDEMRKEME